MPPVQKEPATPNESVVKVVFQDPEQDTAHVAEKIAGNINQMGITEQPVKGEDLRAGIEKQALNSVLHITNQLPESTTANGSMKRGLPQGVFAANDAVNTSSTSSVDQAAREATFLSIADNPEFRTASETKWAPLYGLTQRFPILQGLFSFVYRITGVRNGRESIQAWGDRLKKHEIHTYDVPPMNNTPMPQAA